MRIIKIILISCMLIPNFGFAQDKLLIDEITKKEVLNKVALIMKEKYVFADVGEKMAMYIIKQYEKGEYNSFTEVKPFCKKLTSDLRDVSNDKHLYVFYSPDEAYDVKAYKGMLSEKETKKVKENNYEIERRENFGFRKVEILDGNIGYLELQYFPSPEIFEEKLHGVMNFLSNTDAIIIDLRENGGGEGSPLLESYFLPSEKILLGKSCCRDSTQNTQTWSIPNISGKRLLNTDLYILTSSNTFSAAESFAYTLKNLKRAIIVGEKTKGGAHPVDVLIVKEDILTQIPICESYNPLTKTNWEGVGVKPNVDVSSENALRLAHILALENIISKSSDVEYKTELKSVLTELNKIKI